MREDIHLFEENVIERKKNHLVFTAPGALLRPALRSLFSKVRLREAPPTADCPLLELSCHSPWSPRSVCVTAAWFSSAWSPPQAHWPPSLKCLAKHLTTEAHLGGYQ